MDEGILSLRWNNHRSTFFHILSTLHQKELYSDVTIACEGKFFPVHKLVLSVCSEYFEEMFKKTNCKHPIVVLKDILCDEFEALLNYMYVGEANVAQSDLARLIKAAECLRIRGLAVPDENPESNESKRPNSSVGKEDSSAPKRRRQEESHNKVPSTSREENNDGHSFTEAVAAAGETSNSHNQSTSSNTAPTRTTSASPLQHQRLQNQERRSNSSSHGSQPVVTEVVLEDEAEVKTEPKIEEEIVLESESLTYESEKQGGSCSGGSQTYEAQLLNQAPHNVLQDIMTQGIPSGPTESIPSWDNSNLGGGGFPLEGFSTDESSRASQQLGTSLGGAVGTPPSSGGALLCLFCRRAFMYRSDLSRHVRTHTGEKPYECPHCKYRATQKSHLREHIKRRHPELFLPGNEMLHIKMRSSEMQHTEIHTEVQHTEGQHTEMQHMTTHSAYIQNTELQPVDMQHREIPNSENQYSRVHSSNIEQNDMQQQQAEMHQREIQQLSDNPYSDSEHGSGGDLQHQQSYHPPSSSPSSPINYSTSAEPNDLQPGI